MAATESRNSESSVNVALGNLLRKMLPSFVVRSEQTRIVSGHLGLRPDILITAVGRSPVVVEAEHVPASGAEADARARLGRDITGEARPVESAIALRYPDDVGNAYDLDTFMAEAHLSYCIVYENGGRFPQSGWLKGTVTDLADLIRLVSVPQKAVAEAADDLQQGIDSAASVLNQMGRCRHAPPARHPADGLDHQVLGVVEHLGGVLGERLPADLPAHLEHGPLADACRAEHREIVAVPLIGTRIRIRHIRMMSSMSR